MATAHLNIAWVMEELGFLIYSSVINLKSQMQMVLLDKLNDPTAPYIWCTPISRVAYTVAFFLNINLCD